MFHTHFYNDGNVCFYGRTWLFYSEIVRKVRNRKGKWWKVFRFVGSYSPRRKKTIQILFLLILFLDNYRGNVVQEAGSLDSSRTERSAAHSADPPRRSRNLQFCRWRAAWRWSAASPKPPGSKVSPCETQTTETRQLTLRRMICMKNEQAYSLLRAETLQSEFSFTF